MPKQLDLHTILEKVHLAADEVDGVGRENEKIRNNCLDITQKLQAVASLNDNFVEVFDRVNRLMGELERTKAELVQRGAVLEVERTSHKHLKARQHQLENENEGLKSEGLHLKLETARLSATGYENEARLEAMNAQLDSLSARLTACEIDLKSESALLATTSGELETARGNLQQADALISALQGEYSAGQHQLALTRQDNKSLQTALAATQHRGSILATELHEANLALENANQHIVVLEAEMAKSQGQLVKIRETWQTDSKVHGSELAALQTHNEELVSRQRVTETATAELQLHLQAKTDELRQEERRQHELTGKLVVLEQKLEASEQMIEEMKARVETQDSTHDNLISKIKPLIGALKAKEAECEEANQHLAAQRERAMQEAERWNGEQERLTAMIEELTEKHEREKVARVLAEGALDADRRDRAQLQYALQKAKSGFAALEFQPPAAPAIGTSIEVN